MKMKLACNTRVATTTEVTFPCGLIGFEDVRHFQLADLPGQSHFCRLAALCGTLSLLLVNPFVAFPEYELVLSAAETEELALNRPEEALVLVTVTIPGGNARLATANLAAPLLINTGNRLGRQVIVADGLYRLKEPLFAVASRTRCG
jgi:flagellar assembly factor FliW